MSDFFGKLKSGAEKVAFEAEKMGKLNRAKGDLGDLKSAVQAQYAKLGQIYFSKRSSMGVSDHEVENLCQAITELEQKITTKSEEIQRIDAEEYIPEGVQSKPPEVPAPGPTASAKFCPNCGKEVSTATKFCPDCGTGL